MLGQQPFQASPFLPQPDDNQQLQGEPFSSASGSQALPPVAALPPVPTPQQAAQGSSSHTHGPRHGSIVLIHLGLKARFFAPAPCLHSLCMLRTSYAWHELLQAVNCV
jgi:hypothetical protein